jgi:hypothetical protein
MFKAAVNHFGHTHDDIHNAFEQAYAGLRTLTQPMDEKDHQNFKNRNFETNYDEDDELPALIPVLLNDTELENKADRLEAELHTKTAIKVERTNKIELPETQHALSEISDDDDDWLQTDDLPKKDDVRKLSTSDSDDDLPIFELVKKRTRQYELSQMKTDYKILKLHDKRMKLIQKHNKLLNKIKKEEH